MIDGTNSPLSQPQLNPRPVRISDADFLASLDHSIVQASTEPLIITQNGRDWLALISIEEYTRLKGRARRALRIGDLSETDAVLIGRAEAPKSR
jgi:prevent-host-death family protein